jgi:hypothetical protein
MKNALLKFVRDKDLLKDFFTGIGYFVFIAGIARLAYPSIQGDSWWVQICAFVITISLLYVALLFWSVHVARPIIQLYSPEFGLPELDEHAKPATAWNTIKRLDIWLYLFMVVSALQLGWYVFDAAVKAI